jgi:hypothetical protein
MQIVMMAWLALMMPALMDHVFLLFQTMPTVHLVLSATHRQDVSSRQLCTPAPKIRHLRLKHVLLTAMPPAMQIPLLNVRTGVRLVTLLHALLDLLRLLGLPQTPLLPALQLLGLLLAAKRVEHAAEVAVNAAVETAPTEAVRLAISVANWTIDMSVARLVVDRVGSLIGDS